MIRDFFYASGLVVILGATPWLIKYAQSREACALDPYEYCMFGPNPDIIPLLVLLAPTVGIIYALSKWVGRRLSR